MSDITPPPPPPPPPPDGPPRPDGCKIYALLVGINQYPHARDLKGCVADVDRVANYLKWRYLVPAEAEPTGNSYSLSHLEGYQSLHIIRLVDEQATYANIIARFEQLRNQASEIDKVWFHFSGHGTESRTAAEFVNLENGMDNCLLCYDYAMDAQGNVSGLLADKELAQLLHRVAGGENGSPHIVVSLDCCHSGSGTRGEDEAMSASEFTSRKQEIEGDHNPRPLANYYGYSAGDAYLPPPPHVVLSACTDLQLAGDSAQGGVFTNGLVEALEAAGGSINYADLHSRTRLAVARMRDKQSPQFDVIGDARAYSLFLDGRPDGDPDRYGVEFLPNIGWVVNCGAIHHLPENPEHPIQLSIYSSAAADTPVLLTSVRSVGPQYSTFDLSDADNVRLTELSNTPNVSLYGVFDQIPAPPILVKLSGSDSAAITQLKNAWSDKARSLNIRYLEAGEELPFTVEVTAENGSYVVQDLQLGKRTNATYSSSAPQEVVQDLVTIAKWRRTLALEKDRSALKGKISLQLHITGGNDFAITLPTDAEDEVMTLEATQATMKPNQQGGVRLYEMQPHVQISGVDQPLYCYLFYLYEDYEIANPHGEKSFNRPEGTGTLEFPRDQIGLGPGEDRFVYHIKLIVTTRELDYHQLVQSAIPGDRLKATPATDPDKGLEDWWVVSKTLQVVRKD